MDTFMDKLAQKFNAQEIIKANSAAETEELNRLREQVKEYNECLARMQQICEQMDETAEAVKVKMESAQFDTEGLRAELLQMWQELQNDTAAQIPEVPAVAFDEEKVTDAIAQLGENLVAKQAEQNGLVKDMQDAQTESLKAMQAAQIEEMRGLQTTWFETVKNSYEDQIDRIRSMVKAQISGNKDGQLDGLKSTLETQGQEIDTKMGEMKTMLESQLGGSNEFVHKECVKVYRNVQAVVIDENAKQVENLEYTLKPTLAKVKVTFTVAVLALIASVAGVALQLLSMFNIL